MDGPFFQSAVAKVLEPEGALYAIKVPFWHWHGLKERIAGHRTWESVDDAVVCLDQ